MTSFSGIVKKEEKAELRDSRMGVARGWGVGYAQILILGYKLALIRRRNSWDLTLGMVTRVNSTALSTSKLL